MWSSPASWGWPRWESASTMAELVPTRSATDLRGLGPTHGVRPASPRVAVYLLDSPARVGDHQAVAETSWRSGPAVTGGATAVVLAVATVAGNALTPRRVPPPLVSAPPLLVGAVLALSFLVLAAPRDPGGGP